jgi:hypothetical protein
MFILLVLVIIIIVVVVAVAGGATGLREHERVEHTFLGGGGPSLVVIAGIGGVVVLGGVAFLVFGVRGGGSNDPVSLPRTPAPVVPSTPDPELQEQVERALAPPVEESTPRQGRRGPDLVLVAAEDGVSAGDAVADRLEDGSVLHVVAKGFEPHATGSVAQCLFSTDGPRDCSNRFPVNFGEGGNAEFQYLVEDQVGGRRCDPTSACVLVVGHEELGLRAVAFTVFGGRAPDPGIVTVRPDAALAAGQDITIGIDGYPADTAVSAAQCARPNAREIGRCGRVVEGRTGDDGSLQLHLAARVGEIGPDVECGPRDLCAVVVTADAPVAPVVTTLQFAAGPTADYDSWRVALGAMIAALLLALAVRLVRRTDWREPAEAATPAMDAAVLET